MKYIDHYFATARERYSIRLKREPPPWTENKVYRQWSFCNVHREHDKTTVWLRENVRSKLSGLDAVKAVVAFRWFNRIETGIIVKDLLLNGWNGDEAFRRFNDVPPEQPLFTGAYMIKSFNGLPKVESVLENIDFAMKVLPKMYPNWGKSMREAWLDLQAIPFLGPFMSYEIVCDLRFTDVLDKAEDIMTWTNPGPGCKHGLGRVMNGDPKFFTRANRLPPIMRLDAMIALMREIQDMSKDERYWPQEWEPWEMREPEMWACEYDKYVRGFNGLRLKRKYLGA
jgi:alpha-glutamyl/putrescinyl thymine pyrophosphorylase clade 1